MKRPGIPALIFVMLCIAVCVGAQTIAPSGAVAPVQGIATLSFNSAVLATAEAKQSFEAVQKKFAPREQALQKLSSDIEAERKALSDAGAKPSESESTRRVAAFSAKDKQLQREAEDFKNDYQAESEEAFRKVAQKVYAFVQEYALQHGYTTVLERGSDATPIVWYAAPNIDITEQVVKAYDGKFGAVSTALPESPAAKRPR